MDDNLLDALRRAVIAAPHDMSLRLHLAGLLINSGQRGEATSLLATALQQDPHHTEAQQLMRWALGGPAADMVPPAVTRDVGDRCVRRGSRA